MRDLFYSSGGCKQYSNEDALYMAFMRAHLPEEEKMRIILAATQTNKFFGRFVTII